MACPDTDIPAAVRSRARGCMLGQLAGDSLGSLVEFRTKEQIRAEYPGGVRLLADGGTFDLIATSLRTTPKWRWRWRVCWQE